MFAGAAAHSFVLVRRDHVLHRTAPRAVDRSSCPLGADMADPAQRGRVIGRLMTGLLMGLMLSRSFSGDRRPGGGLAHGLRGRRRRPGTDGGHVVPRVAERAGARRTSPTVDSSPERCAMFADVSHASASRARTAS